MCSVGSAPVSLGAIVKQAHVYTYIILNVTLILGMAPIITYLYWSSRENESVIGPQLFHSLGDL